MHQLDPSISDRPSTGKRIRQVALIYPSSSLSLDTDEMIDHETALRQSKYLNHAIEQEHRQIKRIVKPMMGLKTFNSARRTLSGIEAMNSIRKGQVKGVARGDRVSGVKFIEAIFGIAA